MPKSSSRLEPEALSRAGLPVKAGKPARFVTLCGRIFRDTDPAYFPRASYRGKTLYLCTDSCLGAFLADPDIFYRVHRNSEKEKDRVEPR